MQDSMYTSRIQTEIITCSRFVTKNSTVESRHSNRPPNVSSNAQGTATTSNDTCLKREIKETVTFLIKLYFFSVEITNEMQPCNRIYYSTVH